MTFKLAMTLKELKDRTSKRKYKAIKFLSRDSREVKKLSKEDLMVLCHLTRAAKKIDEVHFKLEDYRIYDDMCVLLLSDDADNEKTIIVDTNFIKLREPKKLVMFNGKDENFTLPTELYDIDLAYLLYHHFLKLLIFLHPHQVN